MKKWEVANEIGEDKQKNSIRRITDILLTNRGLTTKKDIEEFLHPTDPTLPQNSFFSPESLGIDKKALHQAIIRIKKAINTKESIVVYADYDADGITAGAIMWETLHTLGAQVMPYIPHRVDEGYGLSEKGIDTVRELYSPKLIVTVDHGITAREKIKYAQSLGIDVIVTDHHVKPDSLPECTIIHTTKISGAGVSWFLAKELLHKFVSHSELEQREILAMAAIGTIADMMPLVGHNRAIVKYGLVALEQSNRVGLNALVHEAGITEKKIGTYEVSHMLAPRLNAMGRLEHALDALRLLCTKRKDKADQLAKKLGVTNKERQMLTIETTAHAIATLVKDTRTAEKRLLFITDESYNQGVIGLVAGRIVEEYYRPTIVVSVGSEFSKASARSIKGFNIVEAIRESADILVDVGGHPMAAGFTVETKNLQLLQDRLEKLAYEKLSEELLIKLLHIDVEIPLSTVSEELWKSLRDFEPFGFGNSEPVFVSRGVKVLEARLVGAEGKHLKLRLGNAGYTIDAIAFGLGKLYGSLQGDIVIDVAYTIDMNVWNGNKSLQLKVKDIQIP